MSKFCGNSRKVNQVLIVSGKRGFQKRKHCFANDGTVHVRNEPVNGYQILLNNGISIGHKRIQQFKPVEVAKVRFRCTKSVATPKIRKMAVYNVE